MIVSISEQDSISLHHDESTIPEGAVVFLGPEDFEEKLPIRVMDNVRAQLLEEEVPPSPSRWHAATRLWVTLSMAYRPLPPVKRIPKRTLKIGPIEAFWCPYKRHLDPVEDEARRLLSREARQFLDALARSKQKYYTPGEILQYVVDNVSILSNRNLPMDIKQLWLGGIFLNRYRGGMRELILSGLLKKVTLVEYSEQRLVEKSLGECK